MVFELDMDGVRVSCSSPVWTQKLLDRGARLVRSGQLEELRRALGTGASEAGRSAPDPARSASRPR
jgi:hypothetical protein